MAAATDLPRAATDHAGLVVLKLDECLHLMSTVAVGRVAFNADGDTEVLPVNFVLDGINVAFRTVQGSKLGAAVAADAVTFEVDAFDDSTSSGWSVLAKGQAELILDDDTISHLDSKGLRPYVTSVPRPYWVVIRPHTITGRQVPPTL